MIPASQSMQPLNLGASSAITARQHDVLAALLKLSQSNPEQQTRAHFALSGFGGQTDGGSCTVDGGASDTTSPVDSVYLLDPLSDSAFNVSEDPSTDVVVEVVTSTIVDWAPIDGVYSPGDSGPGDSGPGDFGDGGGGGGDSWGPS